MNQRTQMIAVDLQYIREFLLCQTLFVEAEITQREHIAAMQLILSGEVSFEHQEVGQRQSLHRLDALARSRSAFRIAGRPNSRCREPDALAPDRRSFRVADHCNTVQTRVQRGRGSHA